MVGSTRLRRLLLTGAICVLAALAVAADLASYQALYQKSANDVLSFYQGKFENMQQLYVKALEDQRQSVLREGSLSKVKALLAELERFRVAKTLPAEADAETIQEIKACQMGYVRQYAKVEAEMTAALGTLTANYLQALGRLQRELVQAEKLEEATAVEVESKRIQAVRQGYAERLAALTSESASATNAPVATAVVPTPALKRPGRDGLYLVVDLSGGERASAFPVSFLADVPQGGWTDDFKTDKLVLRKMKSGAFMMGSPDDELGRAQDESRHEVTLTRPFYVGVFEVTQRQWERVTGEWPAYFGDPVCRDARPVEKVSYVNVRGSRSGLEWPTSAGVDKNSFIGKLRAKTGRSFDLPTEAQWEYACRAGVVKALNCGANLRALEADPALGKVGRYKCNSGGLGATGDGTRTGTAAVGSYAPNDVGLYDMHANVWEWCLDWYGAYTAKADPKGADAGTIRVVRGGSWRSDASHCRSAARHTMAPETADNHIGLRLALPTEP